MISELRVIGEIAPGRPTVLFIAGSMIDPCVYDQVEIPANFCAGKVDFYHSPGPYDAASIAAQILQYRRKKQLGPLVLVGYSAGGVIAMSAACQSPGEVDGLLLSNTGPCTLDHGDPNLPKRILEQWDEPDFRESFLARCFHRPIPPFLRLRLLAYMDTIDRQAAHDLSRSLRELDLREALVKVTCPVVIAHGIDDRTRPVTHAQMLKDCLPQADLRLIPGGHTVMVENKSGWQAALDELLALVSPIR